MVDLVIAVAPETRLKVLRNRWVGPVEVDGLLGRGADQGEYVCGVFWLGRLLN